MTPDDRKLTEWLCKQIQVEQDPKRFGELVSQLNTLLAMNDNGLRNKLRTELRPMSHGTRHCEVLDTSDREES